MLDTPTKERLCAEDPRSAELLKPFLEGKDLKRWRAEPRGLWLIYIPKNRVRIEDYPAIRDWLLPFKDALQKRATKQEWFELQQAQEIYAPSFVQSKIAYGDITARTSFFMDASGSYLETAGFAIAHDDWALLAILNSKVIWFFVKSLTPLARVEYFRMKSQYINQLPLVILDPTSKSVLADLAEKTQNAAQRRLSLRRALTRRIVDLCPAGREAKLTTRLREWWTLPDFTAFRAEVKMAFKADIPLLERSAWEDWITRDRAEIARLTAEIAVAEARIDGIVYALFELTPEEIALLEASV